MSNSRNSRALRGPTFNAVILYEEMASAAASGTVLQRAAYHAHPATQCNLKPWRVDILRLLSAAEEALTEAGGAHLIVFAGSFIQRPSPWLMGWLEQWAVSRRFRAAALAIIASHKTKLAPIPIAADLSQFAKRHGLKLIVDCGVAVGNARALFVHPSSVKELPLPSVIAQINHPAQERPNRHWGINE
jgi:hypothetical protein